MSPSNFPAGEGPSHPSPQSKPSPHQPKSPMRQSPRRKPSLLELIPNLLRKVKRPRKQSKLNRPDLSLPHRSESRSKLSLRPNARAQKRLPVAKAAPAKRVKTTRVVLLLLLNASPLLSQPPQPKTPKSEQQLSRKPFSQNLQPGLRPQSKNLLRLSALRLSQQRQKRPLKQSLRQSQQLPQRALQRPEPVREFRAVWIATVDNIDFPSRQKACQSDEAKSRADWRASTSQKSCGLTP